MLQQCRPDLKRRIEKKLARAALGGHISASDIVQDACEKVVENHAHFRGRSAGEWRMWVRKIATNFLLRELRKQIQPKHSLYDLIPPGPEPVFDQLIYSSRSPSEKLGDKENQALLRAAVESLAPRDQKLVYYRCELGLKWEEIGQKLGFSGDVAWHRFNRSVLPELELRLEILNDSE